MLAFAFDAITAFSIKLLRIASLLGLLTGFAIPRPPPLFPLFMALPPRRVTGWNCIMAAVAMLGAPSNPSSSAFLENTLGRLMTNPKDALFIIESIVRNSPESASAPHITTLPEPTPVQNENPRLPSDLKEREEQFHDAWAVSVNPADVLVDASWQAVTCPEHQWIRQHLGPLERQTYSRPRLRCWRSRHLLRQTSAQLSSPAISAPNSFPRPTRRFPSQSQC